MTKNVLIKKAAAMLLAMVMVLSLLPTLAFAEDSDVVTINDENLRKAICAELGKDYTTGVDITEEEMAKLTKLTATYSGITDITGIGYAVNLEELNLEGNSFGYSFNGAADLKKLTKLLTLNLSHCSLSDGRIAVTSNYNSVNSNLQSALHTLTQIENLDLSDNGIYGTFSLCNTDCNLKNVDLSNNYICELYMYGTYNQVEYIDLSNNCYYVNELSVGYTSLVTIGIEKVNFENQKNLATLFGVYFYGVNNAVTRYTADNENHTIDIGDWYGDSIKILVKGYTGRNMGEVTINGEEYALGSISSDDSTAAYTLYGLDSGENVINITVTHISGATLEYTLKVNMIELSNDAGITDPYLMSAVCTKLGYTDLTTDVTKEEMASMEGSLSVSYAGNIKGLQYATGLDTISTTYGSFTYVPDLSGITGLTSLTLTSNYCDTLPDSISNMTNLKTLKIYMSQLTEIPDLSGLPLTSLTISTFNIVGYGDTTSQLTSLPNINTSTLETLELSYLNKVTQLPANIGDATALSTLTIYRGSISDFSPLNLLPVSSLTLKYYFQVVPMQGLIDNESIHTLSFTSAYDMGDENYFKNVTTFTIGSASSLTDVSLNHLNPEKLTSLSITGADLQKLPDNLNEFTKLTSLSFSSTDLSGIDVDLNGLTSLTTLNLYKTGISSCPTGLGNLTELTALYLYSNNITEMPDLSSLEKLTTLNISYNYLTEFPSWIKNLSELKTLTAHYNYYTDIPSDVFDNMTALKTVYLGHLVQATGSSGVNAVPVEGTGLTTAVDTLKTNISDAKVYIYSAFTSSLKEISTEYGSIDNVLSPVRNNLSSASLSINIPVSSTELTITPTAFYENSTITYGDVTYNSGDEITIDGLQAGNNTITLTTYNEFSGTSSSNSITYTISIVVGDYVDTFEDGHVYYIPIKVYKETADTDSMAAGYLDQYTTVRYNNGVFAVDVTANNIDWIPSMQYMGSDGSYVDAAIVAEDISAKTRTFRLYTTTLDEDLFISPHVVPMGYSPVCRIIFDTTMVLDISDSVGVDKSDLYAAISSAKAITEGNNIYTDASWAALTSALADAETVYSDKNATDNQVTTALTSLNDALTALTVDNSKLGDKTDLNSAISTASAIEKGDKTDSAWSALQEAIAAAKEVSEKTDAIQSEVDSALATLNTAITTFNNSGSSSDLDKDNLADGTYTIYVEMYQTNRTSTSMTNNAIDHTAILEVVSGEYYITLDFKGMTVGESLGYLGSLSYFDSGYTYDSYGNPEGTLIDAEVLTTQKDSDGNDIIDEYNSTDSLYPDTVTIKLVDTALADADGYVPLKVFVPIMEAIAAGSGDQYVLMKIDWTALAVYDDGSGDTSSDPDNNSNSSSTSSTSNNSSSTSDAKYNITDFYNLETGEFVFTIDAAYNEFVAIYVDGVKLDSSYYTVAAAEDGTTIITLSAEYMNSLEAGDYTIKVEFTDGYATDILNVEYVTEPSSTTSSTTGDSSNSSASKTASITSSSSSAKTGDTAVISIIIIMLAAGAVIIYKKRRRYE